MANSKRVLVGMDLKFNIVNMSSKGEDGEEPISYQALSDKYQVLLNEVEDLRARLAEADELRRAMNEGTATLAHDGTLLYCNRHFAEMLRMPLQAVIGTSIYRFIAPESLITFKTLLEQEIGKGEIKLLAQGDTTLPVYLSISSLQSEGSPNAWCLVATDLTEQKKSDEILAAERLARSIPVL